jgi:AcrR family transcriptional regulator
VSDATRVRLLTTAERLFAERGLAGVSLREIGVAAGQRNNSATQYHFQSQDGLILALCEHRMRPVNERRLALLGALEGDDLRGLVEAFVLPLAEAVRPGSFYLRFLAQLLAGPAQAPHAALELDVMHAMRQLLVRIERCLGTVPAALRRARFQSAAVLVVHTLANHERQLHARGWDAQLALRVADLVDATIGVLTAPASAATRRELRNARRRPA